MSPSCPASQAPGQGKTQQKYAQAVAQYAATVRDRRPNG